MQTKDRQVNLLDSTSDYSQWPGPMMVQAGQCPCSGCNGHDESLSDEQANVGCVSQEVVPEDCSRKTSWFSSDKVPEHSHELECCRQQWSNHGQSRYSPDPEYQRKI